jgi:hypothetical protein
VARLKLAIDAKEASRDLWWRELCRFAAHRQLAAVTALPSDYKQEDEVRSACLVWRLVQPLTAGFVRQALTFLQHVRGHVQFVSLCIGSVPAAKIVAIGDALAEAMR